MPGMLKLPRISGGGEPSVGVAAEAASFAREVISQDRARKGGSGRRTCSGRPGSWLITRCGLGMEPVPETVLHPPAAERFTRPGMATRRGGIARLCCWPSWACLRSSRACVNAGEILGGHHDRGPLHRVIAGRARTRPRQDRCRIRTAAGASPSAVAAVRPWRGQAQRAAASPLAASQASEGRTMSAADRRDQRRGQPAGCSHGVGPGCGAPAGRAAAARLTPAASAPLAQPSAPCQLPPSCAPEPVPAVPRARPTRGPQAGQMLVRLARGLFAS